MKYQLAIQFDAKSHKDFEHLVAYEDRLITELQGLAVVDGHDFGLGEFNFFTFTNDPAKAFRPARNVLGVPAREYKMRAGYRDRNGERYVVLWPRGLREFTIA